MHSALLMALIAAPAPAAAPAAAGFWTDLPADQAMASARREGTPVMIDLYATWCGPCQKLDKDVFPDPEVRAEAKGFVAIKVDGETPIGERLLKRYHVVGYPTVLFLDPSGAEIDRIFGYQPPKEFAQSMRDYRSGRNTVAAMRADLKKRPTDIELAFEVGRRLAIRGERAEAERLLNRVRKADADNAKGLASKAMLTLGKYLHLRGGKRYAEALSLLTQLRKTYPASKDARRALYPLARALHGLERDAEALGALQAAIDADPKDVGAYNTFAWFCFKQDVDRPRGITVAKAGLAVDPKSSGLWDTLAELYHVTGQRDLAVQAINKAVALEPEDPYYKGQLERFSKGKGDQA